MTNNTSPEEQNVVEQPELDLVSTNGTNNLMRGTDAVVVPKLYHATTTSPVTLTAGGGGILTQNAAINEDYIISPEYLRQLSVDNQITITATLTDETLGTLTVTKTFEVNS